MFFKKLGQKGSSGLAELLLIITILMALAFGGLDNWIKPNQYQQADHLKNQYLDIARLNGCIEEEKIVELIERLENLGFENITVTLTDANNPDIHYTEYNRAIRKIGDDLDSIPELTLTIQGNFKNSGFWISILLDDKDVEELPFRLQGTTYTEYIERG